MTNKQIYEDDPIDLLGDDETPSHRATQAELTETSNMNQKLAVMTESHRVSAAPQALTELASSLGYEGELSVGYIEDGLRFYQHRTLESLLEVGKRLLLLKEMTPHGEFTKRVELLGFEVRTAQRFMSAAARTAKSETVSHLATKIKSSKVFLELITHGDEVLQELAELDGIDRMSPSDLRALVRRQKDEGTEESQKLRDKLDAECKKNEILERAIKKTLRPGESAYNARTFEVRHESAALEYGSRIYVDALEVMFDAVLGEDSPAQEKELQLHALGLAAGAIYARAESFYARLKDELDDLMPIQPSGRYMLLDDERSRLVSSISMINVNFLKKKDAREVERNADAPAGRGRPKGSKNKDKED